MSRRRIVRIMQVHGLRGRVRRRFVRTTDSDHGAPVAENLLERDFTATAPNQRWVADVTFLRAGEGWVYLAAILDLFSRYIVGWAVSAVNDTRLVLRALQRATIHRRPAPGLVHHSDQGSTYASKDYRDELARLGLVCSMSRRGDYYDNAVMESWFGTFKTELGEIFDSRADAERKAFSYIEPFYNQRRRHSTLDYISPAEFERRWSPGDSSTGIHSHPQSMSLPPAPPSVAGSGVSSHTGPSP